MDGSSSSKVTVEYHDPSDLFSLVRPQLESRLPLQNLHWKSPTRPLRSIDSLNIDLVSSQRPSDVGASHSSKHGRTSSGNIARPVRASSESAVGDKQRPPTRERRHQIPGLRQTPYLKIYLFRCDDADTYKSSGRKVLRDWIKANTPPSQSSSTASSQENHDAYEWLIVHVVRPDTAAASQPRWGSVSASTATGEKPSTGARWPGRGSSTIFEKLRSDFNISSKSAPDRVAQVRLQAVEPQSQQPDVLQRHSSGTYVETDAENKHAWDDLMAKLKALILLSFDLRVSQYEEDVREKDSQRALPGWNFCTFFVLKEGLARGFENVGLNEDALLGYDELSVGLDSVIQEQRSKDENFGGSFLGHTNDLAHALRKSLSKDTANLNDACKSVFGDAPIDPEKKNYRELIMQNQVSVFEFRCYIFARQVSLLLRQGRAGNPRPKFHGGALIQNDNTATDATPAQTAKQRHSRDDRSEDLSPLAEICERGLAFVAQVARVLREDIGQSMGAISSKETTRNNIVSAWIYSVSQQILQVTSTVALPAVTTLDETIVDSSIKTLAHDGQYAESKVMIHEPKTRLHPARSSSLYSHSTAAAGSSTDAQDSDFAHRQPNTSRPTLPAFDSDPSKVRSGLDALATHRAELLMLQRNILENVGKSGGWLVGWTAIVSKGYSVGSTMTQVDLSDDTSGNEDVTQVTDAGNSDGSGPEISGLFSTSLARATKSIDNFRKIYEQLSDLAIRHYGVAQRIRSQELILGDMAALKYGLGDFAAASMYLHRVTNLYADSRWTYIEVTMLKLHAECLKALNRRDEYIRVALKLLAKAVWKAKSGDTGSSVSGEEWIDDEVFDPHGLIGSILSVASDLPYEVTVPLQQFFGSVLIEPSQHNLPDRDGFKLRLECRHVLSEEIVLQGITVKLAGVEHGQSREILLHSQEAITMKNGRRQVWVGTNVTTYGTFTVDKIIFRAGKMAFVLDTSAKDEAMMDGLGRTEPSGVALVPAQKARILCYPRQGALSVILTAGRTVHIEKQRSLELRCDCGANEATRVEIRLKSASAGLRLRTAEVRLVEGTCSIEERPTPGLISLSHVPKGSIVYLLVPYETETQLNELHLRCEVTYSTPDGDFQLLAHHAVNVELPLDVNVHDAFRQDKFLPVFNVGPAATRALAIADVVLEDSVEFQVSDVSPKGQHVQSRLSDCLTTAEQQKCYSFVVTKSSNGASHSQHSDMHRPATLALNVTYACVDEIVLTAARGVFATLLGASQFAQLGGLLAAKFEQQLKATTSPASFEKAVYLLGFPLEPFETFGWGPTLSHLPPTIRDDLTAWLRQFHAEQQIIKFSSSSWSDGLENRGDGLAPLLHRVTIPVSIPKVHALHTVTLSLPSLQQTTGNAAPPVVVGEPLPVELSVYHTRQWGGSPSALAQQHRSKANQKPPMTHQTERGSSPTSVPVQFFFDLEINPDLWLLCGKRRAHFTAREGEVQTFRFHIVPLRAGELPYPGIDVRIPSTPAGSSQSRSRAGSAAATNPGADGGEVGNEEGKEELVCQTHYRNAGMSVRAVRGWKMTSCDVVGIESADINAAKDAMNGKAEQMDEFGAKGGSAGKAVSTVVLLDTQSS